MIDKEKLKKRIAEIVYAEYVTESWKFAVKVGQMVVDLEELAPLFEEKGE